MSAKPQTIIRAKHDKQNPYFMMRRDTAQDTSLSWEARGMLGYLLSKPDDWEIEIKDLSQQCGKGRVYRIISELKKARYIKDRCKSKNSKTGLWEWTPYTLFEVPYPIHNPQTRTRKPEHGYRDTEKREIEQSTELQNKETSKEPDSTDIIFKQKMAIVRDAGLLMNGSHYKSFKDDADEYTIEQWQAGVKRTDERMLKDGKPKNYNYLMTIMPEILGESKQLARIEASKAPKVIIIVPDEIKRPSVEDGMVGYDASSIEGKAG